MTSTTSQESRSSRSAVTAIVVGCAVVVVALGVVIALLLWMRSQDFLPAEIAISLVVIIGAVIFIVCVACLSIVLKRLNLSDVRYAMGLPEGSIRAILALMLVLLFGVVSVYLVASSLREAAPGRVIQNVTAAQADAIPLADLQARTKRTDDPSRYDVTLKGTANETFDDLSKQLLTTLATLVVAISAFYFGANSVTSAVGQKTPKAPGKEVTPSAPDHPAPPLGAG